jgi:hypothetical protein
MRNVVFVKGVVSAARFFLTRGASVSPNLHYQVLRKAREILRDKRKWTRYGSARTGNGTVCPPYATQAVKFCAYGAIARAALEVTGDRQQARQLARSIEMQIVGSERVPHPQKRLSYVNDHKGYSAVLGLFDAGVEGSLESGFADQPVSKEHRATRPARKKCAANAKGKALKSQAG